MPRFEVCPVAELSAGASTRIEGNQPIAVFHTDEGEFFATSDTCTHEDWSLGEDSDLDGAEVICPLHMARFDLHTGKPLCLPAVDSLRTYAVEIENGTIFVVT